jgi:hypothetical protein
MWSFQLPDSTVALQAECEDYCTIFIELFKVMRPEHIKEALLVLCCCRRPERGVFCDIPVLLSLNSRNYTSFGLNSGTVAADALVHWRSAAPIMIGLLADRYDNQAGAKGSSDEDAVLRTAPAKKISLLAPKAHGAGTSSPALGDVKELMNELRGLSQNCISALPATLLVAEIDLYDNPFALLRVVVSTIVDPKILSTEFCGIFKECFARIERIEKNKGVVVDDATSRYIDTFVHAAAPFIAAIGRSSAEWAGSGIAPVVDLPDLSMSFSKYLEKAFVALPVGGREKLSAYFYDVLTSIPLALSLEQPAISKHIAAVHVFACALFNFVSGSFQLLLKSHIQVMSMLNACVWSVPSEALQNAFRILPILKDAETFSERHHFMELLLNDIMQHISECGVKYAQVTSLVRSLLSSLRLCEDRNPYCAVSIALSDLTGQVIDKIPLLAKSDSHLQTDAVSKHEKPNFEIWLTFLKLCIQLLDRIPSCETEINACVQGTAIEVLFVDLKMFRTTKLSFSDRIFYATYAGDVEIERCAANLKEEYELLNIQLLQRLQGAYALSVRVCSCFNFCF